MDIFLTADVCKIFFEVLEDHVFLEPFIQSSAVIPEVAFHGLHDGRLKTGIAVTNAGLIFFQDDRDQPVFFSDFSPIGINRVGQLDGMSEILRGALRSASSGFPDNRLLAQKPAEDQARARYTDPQVLEIDTREHRIDEKDFWSCPQRDSRLLSFAGTA
jgi:hypothetical protein